MPQLTIKIRTRSNIEAANLGLIIARHHFFSLLFASLPSWFIVVISAMALWFIFDSPSLAIITVWWFKPLYERPALRQLSDLIFAKKTRYWQTQKSVFAKGWLAEITYKRFFASNRIIRHAVNLLEGVDASERRERIKICAFRGSALRWVLALPVFEVLLIYTIIAFLPGLPNLPKTNEMIILGHLSQEALAVIYWFYALITFLFFLISLLSTVFFVCIGFMLYLNSRIINEGWAISLNMQALAKRLLALSLSLVCMLFLFTTITPEAQAITKVQRQQDKQWVEDIVNDPEITPFEVRQKRLPTNTDINEPSRSSSSSFNENFSEFIRLALILALVISVIVLIIAMQKRSKFRHHGTLKYNESKASAKQEIVHENYKVDTLDKAIKFWKEGNMLCALAILYTRLAAKPQAHQILPFILGETESEYLARVKSQISTMHYDFMRELFSLWQRTAYGQQTISSEAVGNLIRHYKTMWP